MRLHTSFALLPLILAGCNYAPSSSSTTTTINGADVLHSVITESTPGVAKFECAKSTSGNCYYTVFTNDCRAAANDAAATTCTTRQIEVFSLAKGESKELAGLPSGFQHCVSQDTKPVAPGCLN